MENFSLLRYCITAVHYHLFSREKFGYPDSINFVSKFCWHTSYTPSPFTFVMSMCYLVDLTVVSFHGGLSHCMFEPALRLFWPPPDSLAVMTKESFFDYFSSVSSTFTPRSMDGLSSRNPSPLWIVETPFTAHALLETDQGRILHNFVQQ